MDARCLARRLAVCSLTAATLFPLFGSPLGGFAAPAARAQTAAAEPAEGAAQQISRWTSRQRSFEIPFQLGEDDTTTVVELYYSFSGGDWQLYERRRGNDGKFVFKAEQDGAYWFTSRTIDAQNRPHPAGPLSAELLVIVDATAPQVEFEAVPDEKGAVQCSWRIEDPGLAPQTLKLEYETGGNWQPIAVDLPPQQTAAGTTTMRGGVTWQPREAVAQAKVRLSIFDAAGNLTQPVQTIKLPTAATVPAASDTARRSPAAAESTVQNDVPRPSQAGSRTDAADPTAAVPWAATGTTEASGSPATEEVAASPYYRRDPAATAETLPPPPGTPAGGRGSSVAQKPAGDAYQLPAPRANTTPPPTTTAANSGGAYQPRSAYQPSGTAAAATAGAVPWNAQAKTTTEQSIYGQRDRKPAATTPVAGPIAPAVTNRAAQNSDVAEMLFGDLPVESTNATSFQLEYDVEVVGPEGVAKVELWITRNRGQDWEQFSADPDGVSPIDVEVSEEGLYGFRVQVTGKNGLGAQPPKSGDQADIWINVDTTKPAVELSNVPYGQGPTAGKLEIYWTAEDQHLAPRPVTLRYSQSPTGPWTTIAASIPNDGKYLWAIEANTPKEVYLRLEVTDKAGNVGVAQLADPVRLQPLIPKARIRGFKPVSRVTVGTSQQTALLR